jgi:uncharacterized damage-inducible protein DinB
MRHHLLALPLVLTLALAAPGGAAGRAVAHRADTTLTDAERRDLTARLERSRTGLFDLVDGLSDAQWNYKAGPDRWSIAEVWEHIIVTEQMIAGMLTGPLLTAPAADTSAAHRAQVAGAITGFMADRTKKAPAPEMVVPARRWTTPAALRKAFADTRAATLSYVAETRAPVRLHALPHPAFGAMDGYQWLLMVATHADRHAAQIVEVKADAGFPGR